jgi:lipid-A-disaccharide synthase
MYRTSWLTYQIGRRLITVRHLAMPNLLSDGAAMPEFIQEAATGEALAAAAEVWLDQPMERLRVRERLLETVRTLGTPGAGRRAAEILAALV